MELYEFLTATTAGKCLFTMLVSMVPIIELRGGIPFGVALGLPYYLAFPAAVIGNILPAPFIIPLFADVGEEGKYISTALSVHTICTIMLFAAIAAFSLR